MSEASPRLPPCRVCGSQMQEVAYIPPFAGKPGLLAYECPKCHAVTSDLEDLTKSPSGNIKRDYKVFGA